MRKKCSFLKLTFRELCIQLTPCVDMVSSYIFNYSFAVIQIRLFHLIFKSLFIFVGYKTIINCIQKLGIRAGLLKN